MLLIIIFQICIILPIILPELLYQYFCNETSKIEDNMKTAKVGLSLSKKVVFVSFNENSFHVKSSFCS